MLNILHDFSCHKGKFWQFPAALSAPLMRPVRLVVRTPPFHGGNTGSSPVRVAISPQFLLLRVEVKCFKGINENGTRALKRNLQVQGNRG